MKQYAEYRDSGIEWIGEIPSNWVVSKIGYYYEVQLGKMLQPEQATKSDTLITYLCAANIKKEGLYREPQKEMWFSENDKTIYKVDKGDLLVVEGGDVGLSAIYTFEHPSYIQNALHRIRNLKNVSNKFLYYYLTYIKNKGYMDLMCNKATISHFTKEKLVNTPVLVPPLPTQQSIADYLDRKTASIDTLIEDKQKLTELLKKYRQAIISEAITKGLDKTAPMKDSGIEWIGEIPQRWEVKKLGYCAKVQTGPFGSQLHSEDYVEEGTPIITVEHFGEGVILHQNLPFVSESDTARLIKYSLATHDLVFSRVGSVDRCVIVQESENGWLFSGRCLRVRFKEASGSIPEYINLFFSTKKFREYMLLVAVGATMPSINTTILNNVPIIILEINEQIEIVSYVVKKTFQIDSLITNIISQIEKLKEYRQVVISEAVTGKLAI